MAIPRTTVEIAFGSEFASAPSTDSWYDLGDFHRNVEGVQITKWRADEFSDPEPLSCTIAVNNEDGRFTPNREGIRNPSFETDVNGWGPIGAGTTLARTTSQAIHGVASLEITCGTTGAVRGARYPAATGKGGIPVLGNVRYDVSCWFRAATLGGNCWFSVQWYDKNGTFLSSSSPGPATADNTTDWTLLDYFFIAPIDAAYANLDFNVNNLAPTGVIHYVDYVSFKPSLVMKGSHTRVLSNVMSAGDYGTFEKAITGFVTIGNGTAAQESSLARQGTKSLKLTATVAATVSATTATGLNGIPVVGDTYYLISGWTYSTVAGLARSASVLWYDAAGVLVAHDFAPAVSTTSKWERSSLRIKSPATAVFAAVRVQTASAAIGNIFYFDEVGLFSYRFSGFTEEFLTSWPALTDQSSTVRILALSQMARLGKGTELRSVLEEEILSDEPLCYYTLGEPVGSDQANDSSGNSNSSLLRYAPNGVNGSVVFGTGDGPPLVQLPAPTFSDFGVLVGDTVRFSNISAFTLEAWVTFLPGSLNSGVSFSIEDFGGAIQMSGGSGSVLLAFQDYFPPSIPIVDDSNPHHLVLKWDEVSDLVVFYFDGASKTTDVYTPTDPPSPFAVRRPFVGSNVGDECIISHFAFYDYALSSTRINEHYRAGTDGFAGESITSRLSRYAAYAKVAPGILEVQDGLVLDLTHIDTSGNSVLNPMKELEVTEGGTLFDSASGFLVFHNREHRFNAAPSFSISNNDVVNAFDEIVDDQNVNNTVTGTGKTPLGQVGVEAVAMDADSIRAIGTYRSSISVASSDPDEPLLAAAWKVGLNSIPKNRIQELPVMLNGVSESQQAKLLQAQIGDRFTLTDTPINAHAASVDLFVEGEEEIITSTVHQIKFFTSPAEPYDVFTFDDELLGRFDSNVFGY